MPDMMPQPKREHSERYKRVEAQIRLDEATRLLRIIGVLASVGWTALIIGIVYFVLKGSSACG